MPHDTTNALGDTPWPTASSSTISMVEKQITDTDLPYWLVNVPRSQWPTECPDFLRDQPEKNILILSTPNERFTRQGWELVNEIIS